MVLFSRLDNPQRLFFCAAPPPRRRRAQSEEIQIFIEEIRNFSEKALTSQAKALPLSHLPRERARRFWGVVAIPMAP